MSEFQCGTSFLLSFIRGTTSPLMLSCSLCSASTKCRKVTSVLVLVLLWLASSVRREDEWVHTGSVTEEHPRLSDFDHFLVHIPKSGGSYAFDALVEMLMTSPQWSQLSKKVMMCDGRMRSISQFEEHYPYSASNHKCNFWMAEQPYTTLAQHNYIITRSPHAHVLSQYFHCKESFDHYDRWKYMPTLHTWLQSWVDAIDNQTLAKQNQKYKCYDPRNLQTRFARVSNNSTDLETELLEKFDVVGDNARMFPTICLIFIRYARWVPPQCDCSQHGRSLKWRFYDHGVRHHGGSYATTSEDDQLIAQLTTRDEPLYQAAKRAFSKQLKQVENEFGIQICESNK